MTRDINSTALHPADSVAAERLWDALYVAGLALMVTRSVGAFLWSPVLWCAVVGLVVIAAAFAVMGGRL
jgi:hypothetical protein